MKFPEKLKKGDTVGLICPSSPISPERVTACVAALENMGFKVKLSDNLTANCAGYMAGSGEERGAWINKMFADPEVNAVLCVRGGDGGTRAFDYVDLEVVKQNPKIFVGYSDVTTWHILFNQVCDLVTFHGPMVSSNMVDGFDAETEKAFFDCINGDDMYIFKNPEGMPLEVLKEGTASGPVIGGNLSLLSAAMATPYEMDTRGKIIFIEEVSEPLTKIEKWTYQLRNAGKFKDCKGVLLGQFTDIHNDYMPSYDVVQLYKDILEPYDIPVMYNLQSGHGDKMITVPLGATCTMDTKTKQVAFQIER